jgi:plastocyanin
VDDCPLTNRKRWHFTAHACRVVLAGLLVTGGVASVMSEARAAPKTYVITIENMRFNPEVLTVKRGDRVVWINKDLFPHTATAETKAFDSRSIEPNASWTYEARKAGEYAYVCTLHPTMKARLTVL